MKVFVWTCQKRIAASEGGGELSGAEMYNDPFFAACGRLQAPLIQKRLSRPFNDAEGQRLEKKRPMPGAQAL